jgi:hypothetical protein
MESKKTMSNFLNRWSGVWFFLPTSVDQFPMRIRHPRLQWALGQTTTIKLQNNCDGAQVIIWNFP